MRACLQALSNSLWAVSKLGFVNGPFMEAIAAEVTAKIGTFNAQNIANSVRMAWHPDIRVCSHY